MKIRGIVVITDILNKAKRDNRTVLTEIESKGILMEANFECNETHLATSKADAVRLSREIGYPVVLKISSSDITHKSDAGGVKTNLKNQATVRKAYDEIVTACSTAYPNATIEGVSVQAMVKEGVELIVGMILDENFGPVIMFGLGGMFVEVLNDVSFRIAPIEMRDAEEMINEVKGKKLLNGYRGMDPVNIGILKEMLCDLSVFVVKNSVIKEIDLNPVVAFQDRAVIVDARMVLNDF